jgi:hypothetical protein
MRFEVMPSKNVKTASVVNPLPKGLPASQIADFLKSLPALGEDGKEFSADIARLRRQGALRLTYCHVGESPTEKHI